MLLILIGAAGYVYRQIDQETVDSPFVPTPTPTRSASSYISQADALYWEGDLEQAIASYEQAIALEPGNVEAYIPLARLLVLEGDLLQALQRAKQAVEMAPEDGRAWAVLGLVHDWRGNVEEAIEACLRGVELNPGYAEGHAYLAEAYADAGLWNKATQQAQKALELNDRSVDAHRNYGYVLEVQGNYWQALEQYQKALEIHPRLAYLHLSIGRSHLALNNFDAAMQSFQKTVEIDPRNAEAFYRVGRAHYERGEHDKAATYLKQATTFDPTYAPAFGYLAFTYWSRRNYEEAIPNLEKAITLGCIAERKRAQSFFITVEDRPAQVAEPTANAVMRGEFVPRSEDVSTLQAPLTPTSSGESWQGAHGQVILDVQTGAYTVTLEAMPQVRYNQAYVGWFDGINTLSGAPLSTAALTVDANGALKASSQTGWVEGPRIEYFYTLGLAHFYMAECEKAYPLFEAALQIDPEEQNALEGIQLCQEAE